ncbi:MULTISPECIES: hypothetical protein [Amycolatopsis]|uniref:hypothetical protein n=1 Tax=Amycolatopsis TaxID=1813 RepID=UPI001E4B65ED|nr:MULTISPECIES: hypothetical protein [Amycolatopsis]
MRRCLEAFARMLRESHFGFERPMTGLEIELNLDDVHASLNSAEANAGRIGAQLIMVGILPTLRQDHLTGASLSPNPNACGPPATRSCPRRSARATSSTCR